MADYAKLARKLFGVARDVVREQSRQQRRKSTSERREPKRRNASRTNNYPGDYRGCPEMVYQPVDDQRADPGEVVWTWVPYEEDHARGKDRPVLIIGHDGPWLLALQLTSKDHDRDAAQEASQGRYWYDIGSGDWDSSGKPSEARVNRVLRVDPDRVRRTGGRLAREIFDQVAAEVAKYC
ncbi:type II toxin-antitoxin system PemK/MazF family toxin [Enemella sp. A6]|uniref:type II toxin-antitoxin system PemK/MazF family toxin n=1 Tax=Enemella sp. A6 TaxID=3440152 RepID=UPI003EBBB6BF